METEIDSRDEVKPKVVAGEGGNSGGSGCGSGGSSGQKPDNHSRPAIFRETGTNGTTTSVTQLTIFYAGNVSVFDGISSEKVHEILRVAAAAAAKSVETKIATGMNSSSPVLARSPSFSSTSPIQPASLSILAADLPIARRHSLQRFLEKRRDRLANKSPYFPPAATKKDDEAAAKLGNQTPSAASCL